jgi:NADPH:quinone reductase-like Zn-dependent oxidoreductase
MQMLRLHLLCSTVDCQGFWNLKGELTLTWQVVVDAGAVMRAPDSFSTHEAAAFMEATITAYLNIFHIGGAKKGDSVLIHGGGSGVGR